MNRTRAALRLIVPVTALAAGLAAPLAGCASTRPDDALAATEPYGVLGYRLQWRGFPLVTRRAEPLFFDAFGERLVFQDSANLITMMDAQTGRNVWSTEVAGPLSRFVGNVLADGALYSASDTELFVLDPRTGEITGRQRLALVVNTRPAVVGDRAIFGGASGQVLGHNITSTFKQWGYGVRGPVVADPAVVRDDSAGAIVAVVSQGGEVVLLDPRNGASFGLANIFGGLANDPVAGDGAVFIAGLDQSVWAFNAADGSLRWRHRDEQPITRQPVFVGGRLYVEIPGRGFTALAGDTGAVLWAAPDVRGEAVALRDGRLVVWDRDTGDAVTLDPQRGDVVERTRLPSLFSLRSDPFEDGVLYTVDPDGRISKFAPRR